MSCTAAVSPVSPTTYAEPPGRWSSRNCAVASADVQMDSSGTSIPLLRSRRTRRSRGVKIELLVSTRNGTPCSRSALMNSFAPGIGSSSRTRTPSMSVSQVWTGRGSVTGPLWSTPSPWGVCAHMDGVAPLELGALDVDVGQDPVQPARQPPRLLADEVHRGGDEEHPYDEGVEEHAEGQAEPDRLDRRVVAEDEAGEHRDHDDRRGRHDRAPGAQPVLHRDPRRGAVGVRLTHPGHQEQLVVHR